MTRIRSKPNVLKVSTRSASSPQKKRQTGAAPLKVATHDATKSVLITALTRPSPLTTENVFQVKKLADQGLSAREIARKVGLEVGLVRDMISVLGTG